MRARSRSPPQEDLRERLAQALALHGWARVRAGAHEEGLGELRRAIALRTATGAAAGGPFVHGLLADALAAHGRARVRARRARRGAALRAAGGERWYEPELHRLRAELLLAVGDLPGAHRSAGSAVVARAAHARRRAGSAAPPRRCARLGSAAPVA